jgi:hypothetical protein
MRTAFDGNATSRESEHMPNPDEARVYRQAISDFCERMGLDDVDTVAQGTQIDVEGVHLSISLNQVIPESVVVSIYVDVGFPPRAGEASVLRALLQQNHHNSASRGLAYCISPANGHVVGVIHVGLGGLEGQGLESLVNMLVDTSLEFRRTYFLWGPSHGASKDDRDASAMA